MKTLVIAAGFAIGVTLIAGTADANQLWEAIKLIFSPVEIGCDPDPRWC